MEPSGFVDALGPLLKQQIFLGLWALLTKLSNVTPTFTIVPLPLFLPPTKAFSVEPVGVRLGELQWGVREEEEGTF